MYIVSYSGGKDSTAVLLWALNHYPKKEIKVIFCDTGAEFPETFDYIKYIEKQFNIEIETIKNENGDFFSYSKKRGKLPSGLTRWCTSRLKTKPTAKWLTKNANRKVDILLTGERKEESKRRESYHANYYSTNLKINGFRPILEWSTKDVVSYINGNGIKLHPAYRYYTRLGCYCCIYNTVLEWLALYKHYPELFDKAVALEEELGYTFKKGKKLKEAVKYWEKKYEKNVLLNDYKTKQTVSKKL